MKNIHKKFNTVVAAVITSVVALLLSAVTWTQIVTRIQVAQFTEGVSNTYINEYEQEPSVAAIQPKKTSNLTATVVRSVGEVVGNIVNPDIPVEVDHAAAPDWEVRKLYTLSIPEIGVRVPVSVPSRRYWDAKAWDLLEEQMQVGLLDGAVAYPHSADPGALGTLIVAGHSSPPTELAAASAYGNVFAKLPSLTEGDEIHVQIGNRSNVYRVQRTEIFTASDTYILAQQDDEKLLKLITCYPIGTSKDRWVITAVLEE